ncbi:MAG TPA: pirin family protein [Nitrospira sp.]|nr:pirin family protein [Nitrospira sp.]
MAPSTVAAKKVVGVYRPGSTHMVGDGFPVRNLFPSNELAQQVDPFLLLDYAGPHDFGPTDAPRGVGEHPHRGFETVTIVYQGLVAHRDSAGHAGVIGPGDVQWMTAASGVVHEELHEKNWARQGGTLQAIQLWVNLPRAVKMTAPGYQTILNAAIPALDLDGAGIVRVIAGACRGVKGPARTFTPIELYDLQAHAGRRIELNVPDGYGTAVFLLQGDVSVNGSRAASEAELIVCAREGTRLTIESQAESRLLIMNGKPIDEPIARYGPFVMNTKTELVQAVEDYQKGKMGHLS